MKYCGKSVMRGHNRFDVCGHPGVEVWQCDECKAVDVIAAKDARIAELDSIIRDALRCGFNAYNPGLGKTLREVAEHALSCHSEEALDKVEPPIQDRESLIAAGMERLNATPSEEGREVPEVVAHLEIDDPTPEEYGDWEVVPVNKACEGLAEHNSGALPLMTVAQHSRIVEAKDAEIARLKELAHETGETVSRLLHGKNRLLDANAQLSEQIAELRAQPASQVGDEREAFEAHMRSGVFHEDGWFERNSSEPDKYRNQGMQADWELWQARAALAPAAVAVVMPERKSESAPPPFERGYNAALDEVARLNRRAIPAAELEQIAAKIDNLEAASGFACGIGDELRALLGKSGE